MGEAALPRSNSVSRVLWDRESGAYFGYRVEVEKKDGPRPFRVSFKPLDRAAVERELKQRGDCPGCPPPAPLGAGPALPGAAAPRRGRGPHPRAPREPGDRRAHPRRRPGLRAAGHPRGHAHGGGARARGAAGRAPRRGPRRARAATPPPPRSTGRRSRCSRTTRPSTTSSASATSSSGTTPWRGASTTARSQLDPGYAEVWNNIGTLEQARKRFKPAVRAYKKAIETKPGLATPWKNLGNAYLALGRVQEAFEAYQEAFRLDPTVLESQGPGIPAAGIDAATQSYYLAKLLAANGQTDAAIEFLRRAKEAGFRDFARVALRPGLRGRRRRSPLQGARAG